MPEGLTIIISKLNFKKMKKIFISLSLMLSFTILFAQSNNPYNETGVDFVSSVKTVILDFKSGKVTSFNQQALDNYTKTLPSNPTIDISSAVQIYKTVRSKSTNTLDIINQTKMYSNFVKAQLVELINNSKNLAAPNFQTYLVNKTTELLSPNSAIEKADKEVLLKNIAIFYNVMENNDFFNSIISSRTQGNNANREEPYDIDCQAAGNAGGCIFVGGLIGGIFGWGICGPPCGLGGAIIGAIGMAFAIC
jgi:hypothetical protein